MKIILPIIISLILGGAVYAQTLTSTEGEYRLDFAGADIKGHTRDVGSDVNFLISKLKEQEALQNSEVILFTNYSRSGNCKRFCDSAVLHLKLLALEETLPLAGMLGSADDDRLRTLIGKVKNANIVLTKKDKNGKDITEVVKSGAEMVKIYKKNKFVKDKEYGI